MSENFQGAGVCGGTWWNPPKDGFTACSPMIGVGTTPLGLQNCLEMKSAKLNQQEGDSDSGSSTVTIDSTLQMMGFNFSSSGNPSSDWNPSILQEDMNSGLVGTSQDCQGYLQTGFPSSYNYSSSANDLLTNLFDQSESSNSLSVLMNSNRSITNFFSPNELPSLSWPKPDFLSNQQDFGIDFPNSNSPFWSNSSTSALDKNGINNFVPSSQPASSTQFLQTQFQEKSRSCLERSGTGTDVRDMKFVGKKLSDEPANKKQRIATPSPLPTFKVRKENLRDQITALQQLVSPFGKTDTASVLQEAIEYIKFLHDQVNVLSTPYMKQGSSVQPQQASEKTTDEERDNDQDLRSRGLCLVPISSTFPVANATTADFWTPSLGGNFR